MNKFIAAVSVAALCASGAAVAGEDPIALTQKYKGDCPICHAIDQKIVGPKWRDVANRYRGQKNVLPMLVEKVVKGGKGHWDKVTGGIAMIPHPAVPTREQIKEIEEAILALSPTP